MNETLHNAKLSWLGDIMMSHRHRISKLLLRLRGIAASTGSNLALHKKFMKMMNQVADEHEKEVGILREIETMEKRHKEMKRQNRLRQAEPPRKKKDPLWIQPEEQPKPRGMGLLALLAIAYLFKTTKPKPPEPKN